MRLIDADELMEHVYRDKLDSRELIAEMIKNAPTVIEIEKERDELKMRIEYIKDINQALQKRNERLKGEVKALAFAVRCNSVSGNKVCYETD